MNNKIYLSLLILIISYTNVFALEKVSLQLQWKHQFEFAGYYMAKEKGFYKDTGLDVDIKEFEHHINIVDDIVNSKTTYGVNYSNLVQDKSNGVDIVLLSAMMQSSPHILISLKSSGINNIHDFKNKRIMINSTAQKTALFTAMLKSNNISESDMIKVEHTFDIEDLINGKTDLMSCFIGNEPFYLDKLGIEYDLWNPKDYGYDFYDIILFTSNNELKTNPKKAEAFRTASLKGWEYAFNHIDETANLILKKYNTQNKTKEALLYEAKILKKLAYQGSDTLGHINKTKIKNIYGVYNLMGLAHNSIDLDSFIYSKASEDINNRYKIDYEYIKYILYFILIVLFLILYRHFILQKANKNLEKLIQREVQENRLKDIMLHQQAKMSDMGELIANIAHQWKQPLAILNVTNAILKEQNNSNTLSKDDINNSVDDMEVNIMQMSQTVDDFLSYFNPNKNEEDFILLEAINKAIFIINQTIKKEDINISINIDEKYTIHGYKDEYIQVVITVIMNSIQALENKEIKQININAFRNIENKNIILEISDTGGGIPQDIIKRIFEPYFTTKHQTNGTGLGLYIAKMIIENSMNGKIDVVNIKNGTKFIISN